MSDPGQGSPVIIRGRPEADWRWYRGHGPHLIECCRDRGQGRTELKVFASELVTLAGAETPQITGDQKTPSDKKSMDFQW